MNNDSTWAKLATESSTVSRNDRLHTVKQLPVICVVSLYSLGGWRPVDLSLKFLNRCKFVSELLIIREYTFLAFKFMVKREIAPVSSVLLKQKHPFRTLAFALEREWIYGNKFLIPAHYIHYIYFILMISFRVCRVSTCRVYIFQRQRQKNIFCLFDF